MAKKTRRRQLERLARRRAEERARRRRTRLLIGAVAGLVAAVGIGVAAIAFLGGPEAEAEDPQEEETMREQPPEMQLDPDADYRAVIETSMGNVVVDLFEGRTPVTVNNFVALARDGFYDGLTFHRVIEGFMIQGGDPQGDGTGGPGYTFEDEIVEELTFDEAGLLAMANAGPNTNGSQFFITVGPATHLDGLHTIFGRVVEGMDVVEEVSRVETDPQERPVEPVTIGTVAIEEA